MKRLNTKQVRKVCFRMAAKHLHDVRMEYTQRVRTMSPFLKEIKKVEDLLNLHWGGAFNMTPEQIDKEYKHFMEHYERDFDEIHDEMLEESSDE